jgi:hypothetical protein
MLRGVIVCSSSNCARITLRCHHDADADADPDEDDDIDASSPAAGGVSPADAKMGNLAASFDDDDGGGGSVDNDATKPATDTLY